MGGTSTLAGVDGRETARVSVSPYFESIQRLVTYECAFCRRDLYGLPHCDPYSLDVSLGSGLRICRDFACCMAVKRGGGSSTEHRQ